MSSTINDNDENAKEENRVPEDVIKKIGGRFEETNCSAQIVVDKSNIEEDKEPPTPKHSEKSEFLKYETDEETI